MRTSTRCDRGAPNWRTRFASSVKIFLTLFLLSSFLVPAKTFAQNVVIDGNAQTYLNEWTRAGITHVADKFNLVNQDTIFGGSSKDYYYAGNTTTPFWTWVLGTAKDKNDIANAAAALVNAVDTGAQGNTVTAGAPFLVFAGDRISNAGDAQIGFWFFQDGTAPVTGGYFSPDKHAPPVRGDILVLADFTNGGRNAAVTVLEWVGTGGNYAGNAAFNLLSTTEAAVAENNSNTSTVPSGWIFKDKNNNDNTTNTTTYSTNEFYEGYVALGNLFGNVPVCFSRFMLETRSTHEITATLDDFVGGPLGGAPQPLSLTGSAACAGTTGTITSSTSVSGLSYQLYDASNNTVQAAQTGTGSGLTWSNIPIGNGYYVITTNPSTQCTATSSPVNVTSVPNPTAAAGPDQTLCQTAPSGPTVFTLAGTASNGTTAWSVVGSTGSAVATITTPSSLTSTVSVAGIGTVTLRLTTTSNTTPACGTATDDIVLTVNANPTASAGPDQALCQTKPSGPTSFTLAGTASNGTTAWSQIASTGTASASITTPSSLTSTVSVSGIGTVTLRLTTTSASCGTATDDVVLTVNANPTADAGPDQAKCQTGASGPTSFTLAGTASNGTTAWSQVGQTGTANASITDPSSLTSTVSVSGIGTVTLRLTTTSASCGTATDDVVLTVNANPTASAGPDQTLCQTKPSGPTSFTLAGTASNGTTAWSQVGQTGTANASITDPSSLTSTVSVSGIGTVTLRLTTTSASCGTATDDVVLTVNANPTASAGPDQTLCQTKPSGPTSFTLAGTASNGTTAWSQIASTGTASASITTPSSLTSTVSVSGIGTVTLRLTTTSGTGCGTATDDVILTVVANATNNAGPDQTLCQTAPSGPTSFTLAGTAANGTSSWSQVGQTGTANASITDPSSLTSTVSVSGTGTVTLRLTTVSDCGTVTDDVVLTVNANPTASAGPDQTLCQTKPSGPTSFTLAGTASNGTTAWSQIASTGTASASITTPSSLTSTVSVSGIGTVTLRLTTTSGTGCGTATDDVILTVNANPTASAGPDQTQCRTASGTNTFGTNTFTLAGTASNGTTAWSIAPGGNPQGYTVNIVTPTSLTSNVEISGSSVNGGTVTLRLTTTSASCGTATDDVVLTLNALPLVKTLTATNFCPNASTGGTVTLQNSQTGVSYQLQKDGSDYGSPQNGTGGDISWSPVPAGTYTVVGTILATSCNTTSGPADVAENSVPEPTADDKDVCVGNTVALTGSPLGGTWSGDHVTGSTFDATGVAAGDYTVTYSVTNEQGCTATATATVHVHALPTPTADNKEVCEGATVDLTGSPSGGTWSGDHVTGSTFDATGVAAGDYTVTYTVTDEFGCTGSTTATVTVKTCGGPLCTYTQGYYGNKNGNSCDADGSGSGSVTYQNPVDLITAELNNGGTLTVGTSGRSVYLPVPNASTTATKLNSVMPGNSTPRELSYAGDVDINSATFNANYLNKQNRINNVLLSQTITLGLNMRISAGLPDLVLQAGTLVTVAPDGPCGTTTAQEHKCVYNTVYPYNLLSDNYAYKTISADIITALNNAGYPLTVSGLFHLASDALGNVDNTTGSEDGATLASINAAVDAINTGFDGCRILVGWNITPCAPYNPPPAITTQSVTTPSQLTSDNSLSVGAYPNPYTDVIKFTIQSNVSGRAQLEVVNMLGQRIATVYNGFIQAHKNQVVEYKVPSPAQQNLIYVLTIGNRKVTGKVLKANE